MDETEIMQDTTPASEEVATETAPEETATAEEDTEAAETEAENTDSAETDEGDATPAEALPFITVKFNGEKRGLSQEEAVTLSQKGLLFDKRAPIYDKLDYLAAQSGVKVSDFVEGLMNSVEDAHRRDLIERYGFEEDDADLEDMMNIYRSKQKEKYEKAIADRAEAEKAAEETKRADRESKLADQFIELKKDFPEIDNLDKLPKSVLKSAAESGDLIKEYLMYKHREARKIENADNTAKKQEMSSTGSARSAELDDSGYDPFLAGLRGRS